MYTNWRQTGFGFTLLEVLIVLAVIGILASMVLFNTADSGKQARDAQRQADLRELQSAIELYKNKYGEYPEGCNGAGNWSGEPGTSYACSDGTNSYILGATGRLFSEFMPKLPTDPRPQTGNYGYVYRTNTDGTVYKIMSMNTVEGETLNSQEAFFHEFKSCDMRGRRNSDGSISFLTESYCDNTAHNIGYGINAPVDHCKLSNSRFQKSYGLWGGFAKCTGNCSITSGSGANTTEALTEIVICR